MRPLDLRALVLSLCCLASLPAGATDVGSAYADGKTFGSSNQMTDADITGVDTSKVPNYNTSPPQTSLFGGPSLFQPGLDKINNCRTYTPTSDKVENQECEAVNFLAKNPYERKRMDIPVTDPIRSMNSASLTNAKDVLSSFGMDLNGTPGQCQQVTRMTDPIYQNEVCYESAVVDTNVCTVGQVVEVDADTNYQCDQSYYSLQTATCNKTAVVTVTSVSNCTSGTFYNWQASACASRDCDRYTAAGYCDPNGSNMIYVFAAGGSNENWGRNCAKSNSGIPITFDASGFGSASFSGTTNFHRCNNSCCGGFSGSVTGLGCNGDTCTATVTFTSGPQWDGRTALPATMTVTYVKPRHTNVTTSWSDGCGTLDSRL